MKKSYKIPINRSASKLLALMAMSSLAIGTLTGCNAEKNVDTSKKDDDLIVVKYGSHCAAEENPYNKNPLTGEYTMPEEERQIKIKALEVVKEELGVDFQFVQYPSDVTECLLQSVLAGDPLADIVRIAQGSQGTVLNQNILLPIDEYVDLLGENPPPKVHGKQYFMHMRGNQVHPLSSLMYNIDYIEEVPSLKVDGKTVYPTDLYEQGKWTWSVFEDYLNKIDDYYASSKAPERPERRIEPYKTHYQEAALQAIHSTGGSIYDDNGLNVDSPETIKGVKFIQNLIDQDLLTTTLEEGTSNPITHDEHVAAFKMGESVFTNFHDWRGPEVANALAKRENSLGFVPFPRPDDMAFDDPNYRQVRTPGETYAILKGTDEDKVEIAIKAYFLYEEAQDRIYLEERGEPRINIVLNMDRFHPVIGEALDRVYQESISRTFVNEMGGIVDIMPAFNKILGDALWGANGSPSYEVAIASNKGVLEDIIKTAETALKSSDLKDNVAPKITLKEPQTFAFPLGTDLSKENLLDKMQMVDNIDGELDVNTAKITFNADVNQIGVYEEGIQVSIEDSSQNVGNKNFKVLIFDPDLKAAPKLTLKENPPKIPLNKDVSTINWKADFVAEMVDASGLPLDLIEVDVTDLDTSVAGEYKVPILLKDYSGNSTQTKMKVIVE